MLGKKKTQSNEDFKAMHHNSTTIISKDHIDKLTDKTIIDIANKTKGLKVAYAWSGGKDSLVLGSLCERGGINDCVLVRNDLEFPEFMEWIENNKPKNLFIYNTGHDLEWLSKNTDMLFAKNSKVASKWYQITQINGQNKYYKMKNLDMIILGRRKKDGNYVGKNGSNVYTTKDGTRYNPISDWTHEEISAYINYNNIEMPPIYNWQNGFVLGTHSWARRKRNKDIQTTWNEVYQIDKSIVINAAKHLESAKEYMEKNNES